MMLTFPIIEKNSSQIGTTPAVQQARQESPRYGTLGEKVTQPMDSDRVELVSLDYERKGNPTQYSILSTMREKVTKPMDSDRLELGSFRL